MPIDLNPASSANSSYLTHVEDTKQESQTPATATPSKDTVKQTAVNQAALRRLGAGGSRQLSLMTSYKQNKPSQTAAVSPHDPIEQAITDATFSGGSVSPQLLDRTVTPDGCSLRQEIENFKELYAGFLEFRKDREAALAFNMVETRPSLLVGFA